MTALASTYRVAASETTAACAGRVGAGLQTDPRGAAIPLACRQRSRLPANQYSHQAAYRPGVSKAFRKCFENGAGAKNGWNAPVRENVGEGASLLRPRAQHVNPG